MNDLRSEPPRLARRLLRVVVGSAEAETTDAELAEGFRARVGRDGQGRARRWYLRQVLGFMVRFPFLRRPIRPRRTLPTAVENLARDVRWAVRGLLRRPSFTAAAVLTLALGIGSNTAVFTLLSAHFLTPLPYERPGELVLIWETQRGTMDVSTVSPGNYFTWREQAGSFSDIAAFNLDNATVSDGDGAAERVTASVVTANFFDVLGAQPLLGRPFREEEVRAAEGRLVILGHGIWTGRYGADPEIVGKDVRVDGRAYRVVGVMPPTFRQPERLLTWQRPELWRPLLLDDQRNSFGGRYLRTAGRLAPGVNLDMARAEMELVAVRMAQEQPEANAGHSILVRTLDDYLLGDARPTLLTLLAAGAAVFLLVCANVANLTLARGEERQREFALRSALGSGHGRTMRQLLIEGLALAAAGALVGTAFVYAAADLLQWVQSRFFSGLVDVRVDVRVILFTALTALLAGLASGLPLVRAARRADVSEALVRGGARAGGAPGAARTRSLLVVGQVALATTLATLASALTRSFNELVGVDPGFDATRVMTFTLAAPPDGQGTGSEREYFKQYFGEVVNELSSVAGVSRVGMISDMPFTSENRWTEPAMDGREVAAEVRARAEFHAVIPEYFDVMGIPLVAGAFPERAWEAERPVPVLVNEEMAERFWPQGDALGAGFRLAPEDTVPLQVVGVVGDVLDDGFAFTPEPTFYVPFGYQLQRQMAFVLTVSGDPADVSTAVRGAVARVDPDVPADGLRMLETLLAETVLRPKAASLIGGVFALLALLVAAAGIYGVLSYTVQSRTREIGIRAALGASRQQLVQMVLGQSTRLLVLGLVLGWIGALLGGRAISGILFGVRAWDPLSLIVASVLLFGAGSVASWLPARRAVRVDPRDALKTE